MKRQHDPVSDGMSPLDAIRILRTAGGALLEQSALHAQLVQIELAQARHRLLQRSIMLLIAFAGLLSTLVVVGGLAIMVSWDTVYWPYAAGAVVIGYAAMTVWAGWRFHQMTTRDDRLFVASREEWAADLAVLRSTT